MLLLEDPTFYGKGPSSAFPLESSLLDFDGFESPTPSLGWICWVPPDFYIYGGADESI